MNIDPDSSPADLSNKQVEELIKRHNNASDTKGYIFLIVLVLAGLIALFWAWRLVSPRYTLYQANIERQVQIADARAKSEAAVFLAESESVRAEGVAEANAIIAESLTPEYVTWLYVDQLDQVEGQIIYIPTEGGIPILEAGRVGQRTGLAGAAGGADD